MSIDTLNREISALDKDIADLSKKIAEQTKVESDKHTKIIQIQGGINKNTSPGSLRSKLSDIDRCNKDIAAAVKKRAEFEKKKSEAAVKQADKKKRLISEEEANRKKEQKELDVTKRRYESLLTDLQRKQSATESMIIAEKQKVISEEFINTEYDVFISHATEDKQSFVEPLFNALTALNIKAFYDKDSIKWGDSIRKKIDAGLANSKLAIVVLSKAFCQKKWTSDELDALFALETKEKQMILPIWHDVTKAEVTTYSPLMAGKNALKTSDYTIEEIAQLLKNMLRTGEDL